MSKYKFGIITPSYAPDFERCQSLCWSIDKFLSPNFNHYIVVERKDYNLFSQLQKPNRKVITKESILPWWIKRFPFFEQKNLWFSLKTFPIRGWILQQIIKLAAAQYTNEDVLVFVDSDLVFIRSFNLNTFIKKDKVRLFRVTNRYKTLNDSDDWNKATSSLLGLSTTNNTHNYVGQIITWRRDNLLKLYAHLEQVSNQEYLEVLCRSFSLSEYLLYGVFVDHFLKDRSGHFYDDSRICHQYWNGEPMSEKKLNQFFKEIPESCVSVMISAKANMYIPVTKYQQLLNQ